MSDALRSALLHWWAPGSSPVPRTLAGAASLAFLVYPAADVASGRLSGTTAIVAATGLAAVAAIYLRVFWVLPYAVDARRREVWALLPALAVLVVALAIGVGTLPETRDSWEGPYVYLAVVTALALPVRLAALGVVAVAAVNFAIGGGINSLALEVLFFGLVLVMVSGMKALVDERDAVRGQVADLAVNEERLRMSRELHDVLGHNLSVIALKSELARKLIERDPEAATREARDVESVARQSLQEARDAVRGLRRASLAAELDRAREVLEAASIEVAVQTTGPLPGRVEAALGAAVREATTNLIRHSRARSCELVVRQVNGVAELEICDDGVGPPDSTGDGSGLRGLAERMAEAGGSLEVGPAPVGGFRLTARVPVPAAESADEEPELVTWTKPISVVPPLRPLRIDPLPPPPEGRDAGGRQGGADSSETSR